MKNMIFSLLTLSLLGISCQKEGNPTQPPVETAHYMSLTAGSTWNYELIDNLAGATTTPFTLTATDRDSTINGKAYHVFTNSSGSANEYYNITGNDYYNFRSLPEALGGSSVEYLYLKDNAAVGSSWSQTFPVTFTGVVINATLTNTITEKAVSKTVKGIAYEEVIHVTTTLTFVGIPMPPGALVTDIQSFYARKYGMIQSINKLNLDFSGITSNTDQQTNLNTTDIK